MQSASSRRLLGISLYHGRVLATVVPRGSFSTATHHWSPTQRQLLQDSVRQVPEYGWTQDAVAAAATASNQSIARAGLVQAPGDLVTFCMDEWNDRLRQELRELTENEKQETATTTESSSGSSSSNGLVDRLQQGFQLRLSYQKELLQAERWHQAMAIGARPDNVATTKLQLEELVEIVVNYAHDSYPECKQLSVPEQLGLGAVYVAAELHWLASPQEEDWSFLRQQLEQWDALRQGSFPDFSSVGLPDTASAAAHATFAVGSAMVSGVASLVLPPAMDPKR